MVGAALVLDAATVAVLAAAGADDDGVAVSDELHAAAATTSKPNPRSVCRDPVMSAERCIGPPRSGRV